VIADNLQDAFDVLDRMAAADIFSFDLETSGFSCKSDKIICWSFADEEGKAYVIPLQDVDKLIFEGDKLRALNSRLQEFLFTPNNPFVGWNHQFDLNFLYEQMGFENRGKLLDNWFADGMLMHHLLEEEMPHNLEYVASLHTSMPPWDGDLKQYKKKHKIKTYRDIPGDILWPYAGKDADATLRLFYKFLPRLENENLGDFYFDHQHHMAKVFSKMAYHGVPVDLEYLQGLRDSVSIKLEDVMEKIFEAAGERFNSRSHKQKAVILYDKLGLPEVLPRTDAGNRSTTKEAMQMLADQHPVPKLFVRHSELDKMMTSYLGDSAKTIFSNIDEDGFCRTSWHLPGTETGRCSSSSPNLTNIPRGGGFREAFKAPVGWKMIEADYSQAEFRYAAYRAGETEVIAMLDAGYDGHQASAAAVFNVPIDEVTPEQRSIGKTVNFLIQYGGGPGQLAKSAGVTYRKAELIIRKFFKKRKALVAHMREIGRQALDPDIRRIVNVYGRVRHMPVGFTKEARQHIIKEAVNFDPQGGVADTLWRSMILLDRWFEENEMLSYFIIALHDGLYILSPDEEVDAVVVKVEEIMTLPLPVIGAALPVDMKVGERWESKG
jgi:DNA polymerase-1